MESEFMKWRLLVESRPGGLEFTVPEKKHIADEFGLNRTNMGLREVSGVFFSSEFGAKSLISTHMHNRSQ
jgi:hypothetical protein